MLERSVEVQRSGPDVGSLYPGGHVECSNPGLGTVADGNPRVVGLADYHVLVVECAADGAVVGVEDDMKKLPVNFAVTDDTGAILNLSDDMLKVLGLSRVDSIGKNIGEWFSPVSKTAEIHDKIWDVTRKSVNDGKRYYFELNPKGLPVGDTGDGSAPQTAGGDTQLIDPDTQLHTYRYGMTRISEELYRAERYNHPVSAVMIRIVFPQLLPDENMEKYILPFRAYCERVKNDIRQTDTAIQTGEFQIMVLFAQCEGHQADEITQRLVAITNALCPTFEEFLHVTVLNVIESFEDPANIPSAQDLIDRMTHAMTRKYSAASFTQ